MTKDRIKNLLLLSAKMGLVPLLFYSGCFGVLTYATLTHFSTHLYADAGDGLQTFWDLWWVKKAVTELHQSPWQTHYLHWPYGLSLVAHTLHPFDGLMAIFLSQFLTLPQIYNLIAIVSFLVGGLTAFLLAYHITGSYWPSVIGGFIFTFSNYHFAHAEGHLQLVSLEWIPLFILLWFKLVSKPTIGRGVGAAVALFLVILCDYYYFFYCVLTALMILSWRALRERSAFFFTRKEFRIPLGIFSVLALATSGVLAVSLVLLNRSDPLWGSHPAIEYSMDLLAPFIYGGHWRFAFLTQVYWSRFTGNIEENSVHLGLSVWIILIYVWRKRKVVATEGLGLWFFIFGFFAVMALGPVLQICGKKITGLTLPYAWFETLFPPLRFSGVPVRMMIMVTLSASVICAAGFKFLFRGPRPCRAYAAALLPLLFVEYLPRPIPCLALPVPEYVKVLKSLPEGDGVIDTVANTTWTLFYQTIHEKPLAFGFLARIPKSVDAKDRQLAAALKDEHYATLWRDYHIRYLVTKDPSPGMKNSHDAKVIWNDGRVWVFDLRPESRAGS